MADVGDNVSGRLDRWYEGDALSARHWNQPVDLLRKIVRGVAPPRQTDILGGGLAEASASEILLMTVTRAAGNVSTTWDTIRATDGVDETEHHVAKPFSLRPYLNRSFVYNGDTFNYRYTSGETRDITHIFGEPDNVLVTQYEEIVPFYAPGDLIYVIQLPEEMIGPIYSPVNNWENPFDGTVVYADLNVAGRAWGAVRTIET